MGMAEIEHKRNMLNCLHAKHSLSHFHSEQCTGRCRVPRSIFISEKAGLGWIFHIRIAVSDEANFEVLCTAWPHSQPDQSTIIIDDSVFKGNRHDWIIAKYPPNYCMTLRILNDEKKKKDGRSDTAICQFGGYAVANGFSVFPNSSSRDPSVPRKVISPGTPSIVNALTLLISLDDSPASSRDGSRLIPSSSPTSVVQNIIRMIVFPLSTIPNPYPKQFNMHGILLSGPPGVGKSYAITAAQELCKDTCKITVHNLSIPEALSSIDPVRYVHDMFSTALADIKVAWKKTSSQDAPTTECGSRRSACGPSTPSAKYTPPGAANSPFRGDSSHACTPPSPTSSRSHVHTMTPITSTPIMTTGGQVGACGSGAGTNGMRHTSHIKNSPFSFKDSIIMQTPTGTGTPSARRSENGYQQYTGTKSSMTGGGASTPHHSWRNECGGIATEGKQFRYGRHNTSLAQNVASESIPAVHIIMVDEIDALGSGKQTIGEDTEVIIKSLLCQFLDFLSTVQSNCAVIATSNRPEEVDACFRRGGRLDKELDVLESSEEDRFRLLSGLIGQIYPFLITEKCGHLVASARENTTALGVARQLNESASCITQLQGQEAAQTAIEHVARIVASATDTVNGSSRCCEHASAIKLSSFLLECLLDAKSTIPPSCLRGDAVRIPTLQFEDIIGYDEVKVKLGKVLGFAKPESRNALRHFGISSSMGGVLLYGPPGNSKTRLVMAAASTYSLPVISLSVADVYSAYVGNAEAEIRRAFRLARQAHPCVLFLDELDALVTDRGTGCSSSSNVESRVLASLLTEMDGIDGAADDVFVVAATNRLESIDAALLRKGRFHHILHVSLPTMEARHDMVNYFGDKYSLSETVRKKISHKLTDLMSGADVENLCREEGMNRIKSFIIGNTGDVSVDVSPTVDSLIGSP